jgi:hypothetical protein
MYEVEFKLDGMTVVPTHKNCGIALNEKQVDKFQKELVKTWGIQEEEEK